MKSFLVYSFLILSVAVVLCSAGDDETKEKTGVINKTLGGIGKAAETGAAAINKAANTGAAAVNKATDKAAEKIDEIRNPEEHEHGQGKLIPSAYGGVSRLAGVVTSELGNMGRAVFSGVRNTGKAVGETLKYSAMRMLPPRFRNNKSNKEDVKKDD